jgi:hypothetical protein
MSIEITPIRNGFLVSHGPNTPAYFPDKIAVLEYVRKLLEEPAKSETP